MTADPTTHPGTTTTSGTGTRTAAVLGDVATAAAGALPSPSALSLGALDGSLAPPTTGTAVLASFTGATSGSLAIVVDPSLEAALGAAEDGALSVAEAVQPALEAAGAAIGPCVLSSAQVVAAGGLLVRGAHEWAPLVGDGGALVWVGLEITGGAAAGVAAVVTGRTQIGSLNLLRDVEMTLSVELGRTTLPVRDLLALAPGSVVELDRAAGAPADLLVNGKLLARGEIVVVDEDYGLRITEIVDPGGEV